MSFWIIAIALTCLALAPMVLVLNRKNIAVDAQTGGTNMQVYKDQLAEVERDVTRGVLSDADARTARLEVSRRLLDADKTKSQQGTALPAIPLWATLCMAAALLAGAATLYLQLGAPTYEDLPLERRLALSQEARENRVSQADAEARSPQALPAGTPDPEHVALVERLQVALLEHPNDLKGQVLLARNASAIGKYRIAHAAHAKAITIKGNAARAQDYADYADSLILAVNGYVTPEAEAAITSALSRDPQNGTANYYAGDMFGQIGRYDLTFSVWSKLLERSTASDPWVSPIAAQIANVAELAGVRYTVPVLANTFALPPSLNGPDAGAIEAASNMSSEDRGAFIQSMVDQLSSRLASSGGTPAEWAQLIGALGVLGDTERASAIWTEAQVIFGADPNAIGLIRDAAKSAGVAHD